MDATSVSAPVPSLATSMADFGQMMEKIGCPAELGARIVSSTVQSSKPLQAYLEHMLADGIASASAPGRDVISVSLPEIASPGLLKILRDANGDMRLEASAQAADAVGHPLARAQRRIDHARVFRMILRKFDSHPELRQSQFGNDYDVAVVEIGGDIRTHLNENRTWVHVDAPILDAADVARHAAARGYCAGRLAELCLSAKSQRHALSLARDDGAYMCHNRSQDCPIRAPVVVGLHSLYNIDVHTLARIMNRKEAEEGYFTVHYTPEVVFKASGDLVNGMKYSHMRDEHGRRMIEFYFPGVDTQPSYVHDYASYLRLCTTNYFDSADGHSRFMIHRERYTLDTLLLKVTRLNCNMSAAHVRYRMPCSIGPGFKILRTWKYDTIQSTAGGKLIPILLMVPEKLEEQLLMYAMSLAAGKFLLTTVMQAAVSFNSRTVISGQSMSTEHSLSPENLYHLVLAVYVKTFILNWECGKCFEHLKTAENTVRTDMGTLEALYRQLRRVVSAPDAPPLRDVVNVDAIESSQTASQYDTAAAPYYARVLKMWRDLHTRERQYPIETIFYMEMTLDQFLPSYVAAVQKTSFYAVGGVSDRELSSNLELGDLQDFIDGKFTRIALGVSKTPNVSQGCTDCSGYKDREVPGDGDCFFHSMEALLSHRATPAVMKTRLRKSAWLKIFSPGERNSLMTTLNAESTDVMWATNHVVALFALEYDVGICVEDCDTGNFYLYNPKNPRVCHLSLSANHFRPKLPTEFVYTPPLVVRQGRYSQAPVRCAAPYERAQRSMLYKRFNNTTGKVPNPAPRNEWKLRSDLIRASCVYDALSATRNFGYESGYALMLHAALSSTGLLRHLRLSKRSVLDVSDANHSSAGYYAKSCDFAVTSISDSMDSPYVDSVNVLPTTSLDTDTLLAVLGRVANDGDYDLVSINPPRYTDNLHIVNEKTGDEIARVAKDCVRMTKIGGSMIVAVPIFCEIANFFSLVTHFREYSVVRPRCVPGHSPYVMLVLRSRTAMPAEVTDTSEFMGTMQTALNVAIPEFSLALGRILRHATKNLRPAFLPQFDYVRLRNAVCGDLVLFKGGSTCTRARAWVPRFDVHTMCEMGIDATDLSDREKYRRFTQRFCERVRETIFEQFPDVDVRRTTATTMSAIVSALSDHPAHNDGFTREYMKCHIVNTVQEDRDVVSLRLSLHDLHDGATLDASRLLPVNYSKRYDALIASAPPPQVRDNALPEVVCALENARLRTIEDGVRSRRNFAAIDQMAAARTRDVVADTRPQQQREQSMPTLPSNAYDIMRAPGWEDELLREHFAYSSTIVKNVVAELQRHGRRMQLYSEPQRRAYFRTMPQPSACKIGTSVYGKFTTSHPSGAVIPRYRYVYGWADDAYAGRLLKYEHRTACENYIAMPDTEILVEADFSRQLRDVGHVDLSDVDVKLVQAAAGCGKTTDILNKYVTDSRTKSVQILTSTREGAKDIKNRLVMRTKQPNAAEHVRTIDSYLLARATRADILYIDEALMQHPGKLVHAIHKSRAKVARLYGDRLQIPFVNRLSNMTLKYAESSRVFAVGGVLSVSYRTPADVAFVLNPLYLQLNMKDGIHAGMSSASAAPVPSMTRSAISSVSGVPIVHNAKYLTFTQHDKDEVEKFLGNKVAHPVNTVHEYQGKEHDNVILVRLKVGQGSPAIESINHCVTAITRHRGSLRYYSAGPVTDIVSTWIRAATEASHDDIASVRPIATRLVRVGPAFSVPDNRLPTDRVEAAWADRASAQEIRSRTPDV